VPARNVQEPAVFWPSTCASGRWSIRPEVVEVEAEQGVAASQEKSPLAPYFWRGKCSFPQTMKEAAEPITFIRRARQYFSLRHSGWLIGIYDRLS
jgi:hypothetical protein